MFVNIFLIPANAIAPEGSTMLRFSSNVSLIAAEFHLYSQSQYQDQQSVLSYQICANE